MAPRMSAVRKLLQIHQCHPNSSQKTRRLDHRRLTESVPVEKQKSCHRSPPSTGLNQSKSRKSTTLPRIGDQSGENTGGEPEGGRSESGLSGISRSATTTT